MYEGQTHESINSTYGERLTDSGPYWYEMEYRMIYRIPETGGAEDEEIAAVTPVFLSWRFERRQWLSDAEPFLKIHPYEDQLRDLRREKSRPCNRFEALHCLPTNLRPRHGNALEVDVLWLAPIVRRQTGRSTPAHAPMSVEIRRPSH
jgi:hypothetical protein